MIELALALSLFCIVVAGVFLFVGWVLTRPGNYPQWVKAPVLCSHCGQLVTLELRPENFYEVLKQGQDG
jgi:hypothetical protein